MHQTARGADVQRKKDKKAKPQAAAAKAQPYGNAAANRAGLSRGRPQGTPAEALQTLENIIAGTHGGQDAPFYAAQLDDAGKKWCRAEAQLQKLAQKVAGDAMIQLCQTLGDVSVATILGVISRAATPPAAASVAALLTGADSSDWADIVKKQPAAIAFVRRLFPKTPPTTFYAIFDEEMLASKPLMTWLVTTATPFSVAKALGNMSPKVIVKTLNAIPGGWKWLDGVPDAAALDQSFALLLTKMLPFVTGATKKRIDKLRATAKTEIPDSVEPEKELAKVFAGKLATVAPDQVLIWANAANADDVKKGLATASGRTNLAKALKSADRVLQLLKMYDIPLEAAVLTLAAAAGKPAHLPLLLSERSDEFESALVKKEVIQGLQVIAGSNPPPMALFNDDATGLKKAAAKSNRLAKWLTKGAAAATLWWLLKGISADHVAKMANKYKKFGLGFDWLTQVPIKKDDDTSLQLYAILPRGRAKSFLERWHIERNRTTVSKDDNKPKPSNPKLKDAPLKSLREALAGNKGTAAELLGWFGASAPAEQLKLVADHAAWPKLLARLDAGGVARVVRLTNSSRLVMLKHMKGSMSDAQDALASVIRDAPAYEQLAIAQDKVLFKRVIDGLSLGVFACLPALRHPLQLAAAAAKNTNVIKEIAGMSDPVTSFTALGADDVVAKASAKALDAIGRSAVEELPSGAAMPATLLAAVKRIRKFVTSAAVQTEIDDALKSKKGERDNDAKAGAIKAVDNKDLKSALSALYKANKTDGYLTVCQRAPKDQVEAVLRASEAGVEQLRRYTDTSLFTAFPALGNQPTAAVYATSEGIKWLLSNASGTDALRLATAVSGEIPKVGRYLDKTVTANAPDWFDSLPSGAGLAASECKALRKLFDGSTKERPAEVLFEKRFAVTINTAWKRSDLAVLWTTLERLPEAHVEANKRIKRFEKTKKTDMGGSWSSGSGKVSVSIEPGASRITGYAKESWRSLTDMATHLGISEGEVEKRVTAGSLEKKTEAGKTLYRIKKVKEGNFAHTVLHEVGHAVDTMLGEKTDLVYGQAGWKQYGSDAAGTWLKEMGGWSGASVDKADRKAIADLFALRVETNGSIDGPSGGIPELVPSSHPIHKAKNKKARAVENAHKSKSAFFYHNPLKANGRVFLMNFYYTAFMSVKASAVASIPRSYTGFSPAEWFADCYAEYYRGYDGTPATESAKGGNLPGWVKKWFDVNVDKLGKTPHKVNKRVKKT